MAYEYGLPGDPVQVAGGRPKGRTEVLKHHLPIPAAKGAEGTSRREEGGSKERALKGGRGEAGGRGGSASRGQGFGHTPKIGGDVMVAS